MTASHHRPAYNVPLSAQQLQLLGEVVLIIGQIDDDLALMLTGALTVDRPTANAVMRGQDSTDLWKRVMLQRHSDPLLVRLINLAAAEIKALSGMRNDFIHADYRAAFPFQGEMVTTRNSSGVFAAKSAVVSRHRDQKRRTANELLQVREKAGRTSCLVAHIRFVVRPHNEGTHQSPWLKVLSPLLTASELEQVASVLDQSIHVQEISGLRPQPV